MDLGQLTLKSILLVSYNKSLIIIIKNIIIIIIRILPACFAHEKFSMLINLVNLRSKRTLYRVVFTTA